jgi:alpha-1,6-mannosyltransferase
MKRGVLIAAALSCATYLSTALTGLGIDKFHYILAGGEKFGTFPNLTSQLGIGFSYLALFGLYLYWLFQKPSETSSRFIDLLKGASLFLLLAFLAYPLGNDLYLYLHSGLMNLSHVNPFLTRANAFISGLSPFVDWGQTSTYGPVSQTLFTLSAAVIPINPILAIYTYKLFCLGLHILNGYIIWRLLSNQQRDKIAFAYLINPLLLMEQVGSGHVDVLVSTSLVTFTGCLLKQRYGFAFLALWGGFLAKTIPLIWMPLMAVFLIRHRRWGHLLGISLLSLGIIVVLWFTALPSLAAWKSLLNPGVTGLYQASLHSIVKFGLDLLRIFVPGVLTLAQEKLLLLQFSHYMLICFTATYGWIAWRTYRQRFSTPQRLVENMGWATLVLLLVATPWLMPWYASVLLTIAALIPGAQLFGLTSLAFGLSSSAQYLLQGHDSLKSVVAIGLPLLAFVVGSKLFTQPSSTRAFSILTMPIAPDAPQPDASPPDVSQSDTPQPMVKSTQ